MPLVRPASRLDKSNAGPLLIESFRSNAVVKALVLMPGCTDEIYFFEKAVAELKKPSPTLLDAVVALTNQTAIKLTFQPPFLLLYTAEDRLEGQRTVLDAEAMQKIRKASFIPHLVSFDKDWNYLLPLLEKSLKSNFFPQRNTTDSWHFYRHTFAAHGLNGEEALQAIALAGMTVYTVEGRTLFGRPKVRFEPDRRSEAQP